MSTKNILIYFLCEVSQTIIPSVEVCSTFNMAFLKKWWVPTVSIRNLGKINFNNQILKNKVVNLFENWLSYSYGHCQKIALLFHLIMRGQQLKLRRFDSFDCHKVIFPVSITFTVVFCITQQWYLIIKLPVI